MAPIMEQIEVDVGQLLIFISTLLMCSSLIIVLALCGCCSSSSRSQPIQEGKKSIRRSEPSVPPPPDPSPAASQQDDTGKTSVVLCQKSDRGGEKSKSDERKSLTSSKKYSLKLPKPDSTQQPMAVQPKTDSSKAAPKAGPKSQPTAALDSKKSLGETKVGNAMEGSVLIPNQVGIPSTTGEPTYPADAAVEYENPAYDTIGPEFDDPFPGQQSDRASEPPLKVAVLVESVQQASEADQSKRGTPAASASYPKTVMASKSMLPSSKATGVTKSMVPSATMKSGTKQTK